MQRNADTTAHAYDCKIVKHDMSARRFVMAMTHNLIPNLCMPVPNVVSHGATTSNAGKWRGASFGSSLSLHRIFRLTPKTFPSRSSIAVQHNHEGMPQKYTVVLFIERAYSILLLGKMTIETRA